MGADLSLTGCQPQVRWAESGSGTSEFNRKYGEAENAKQEEREREELGESQKVFLNSLKPGEEAVAQRPRGVGFIRVKCQVTEYRT